VVREGKKKGPYYREGGSSRGQGGTPTFGMVERRDQVAQGNNLLGGGREKESESDTKEKWEDTGHDYTRRVQY